MFGTASGSTPKYIRIRRNGLINLDAMSVYLNSISLVQIQVLRQNIFELEEML